MSADAHETLHPWIKTSSNTHVQLDFNTHVQLDFCST